MHCGIPKGISQAEASFNSERIKPVTLAVIECSQTLRQWKIPFNMSKIKSMINLKVVYIVYACLSLLYL